MPNFWDAPDILPLPSLQAYSSLSFIFFSYSLYYAFQVTSKPNWKALQDFYLLSIQDVNSTIPLNFTEIQTEEQHNQSNLFLNLLNQNNTSFLFNDVFDGNPYLLRLIDVAYIMVHQPLCVWTLINMCYCLLILMGKVIQKMIFGDLRASEQQLIRDSFWNFLFDKFIFVFSVINVQYMDELILWCGWFSILGFMFMLTYLCKERFNYLSFSPSVSKWVHIRLISLLSIILVVTIPLFAIGIIVAYHNNFSFGVFLLSECVLLFLRTLYCVILYIIHLWDINSESLWEKRASFAYAIELIFDLLILLIDFGHHLHMLFWGNIIVSLSSLVILFQLRSIFGCIKKRIKKHKNYLQVLRLMEENFPVARKEELENNNDDCAICWDPMTTARRLPCGHLFHTTCLRSWLEQDTSCPTCRLSLNYREAEAANNVLEDDQATLRRGLLGVGNVNIRFNNHFFHFDGPRYSRWLPIISVEVTPPNMIDININTARADFNTEIDLSELEHMGQQVLEFFPQISLPTVLEDLRLTRSVEHTIENILENRIRHTAFANPQDNIENIASEIGSEPDTSYSNHFIFDSTSSEFGSDVSNIEQIQNPDEPVASTSFSVIDQPEEEDTFSDIDLTDLENRFSRLTPSERRKLLLKRKDEMLKKAKNKFK